MKNVIILNRVTRFIPALLVLSLAVANLYGFFSGVFGSTPIWFQRVMDWLSTFAAVFLGIFIEAVPYLLLGTLASGMVEVFFDSQALTKLIPRQRVAGVVAGSLFGLFFPVCECGVVPLTRRLMQKGLPISTSISFLLAAPVFNPIVIASTYSAFGFGAIFWGRIGLTLLISTAVGLIFSFQAERETLLRPTKVEPVRLFFEAKKPPLGERIRRMLVIAADEFFEMGRYLVIGGLLAAAMQTLVPQSALLAIGEGSFLSVIVMILLAVLLSVCSTVDAFIALAFASTFSSGSVLAFLVYGPMVDIKSALMFLRVFKPRTVVYLVVIPLLLSILAAVTWNVFVR